MIRKEIPTLRLSAELLWATTGTKTLNQQIPVLIQIKTLYQFNKFHKNKIGKTLTILLINSIETLKEMHRYLTTKYQYLERMLKQTHMNTMTYILI